MSEYHTQDWLLIVHALVHWAGPDTQSARDRRAWELADEIASREGIPLTEAVRQADLDWAGPE
jgi:hypothetical protein